MKIPQVESDIDLEVVNSYTTDLSGIDNIITVDDKSTWVKDSNKQVIRQINIDNDNIRVMTLRRMVLFLLILSRVLYLNCYHQTEVCHCLMSMSCQRYDKKSALWL
jgi:hypothetical protein